MSSREATELVDRLLRVVEGDDPVFRGCETDCQLSRSGASLSKAEEQTLRRAKAILTRLGVDGSVITKAILSHGA